MYKEHFEFLEHTADLKFIAYGKTLDELFQNSAMAIFYAMLENIDLVSIKIKKEIELKSESIEILLHDFLSELLFIFETSSLILKKFEVKISQNGEYYLKASVFGEKFDRKKHRVSTEVKAITYHDLFVKKTEKGWMAQVVCDI
ncbi:MAG: archease [Candidatus Altiarchaeota archaeon]